MDRVQSPHAVGIVAGSSSALNTLNVNTDQKHAITMPDDFEPTTIEARKARLKRAIEASGLTLADLDEKIGRKRGYTGSLLSRAEKPNARTFLLYCAPLGIEPKWLLDGEEPVTKTQPKAPPEPPRPAPSSSDERPTKSRAGVPPVRTSPATDLRDVAIELLRDQMPGAVLRTLRTWPEVEGDPTISDWIEAADWALRMGRRVAGEPETIDPSRYSETNPILVRELAALRKRLKLA